MVGGRGPFDAFVPPGGDTGQGLEASDDGQNYHVVATIPKGGSTEHTLSFAPVTAKYFRVTFKTMPPPPSPFGDMAADLGIAPKPPTDVRDRGTGAASRRASESL